MLIYAIFLINLKKKIFINVGVKWAPGCIKMLRYSFRHDAFS